LNLENARVQFFTLAMKFKIVTLN